VARTAEIARQSNDLRLSVAVGWMGWSAIFVCLHRVYRVFDSRKGGADLCWQGITCSTFERVNITTPSISCRFGIMSVLPWISCRKAWGKYPTALFLRLAIILTKQRTAHPPYTQSTQQFFRALPLEGAKGGNDAACVGTGQLVCRLRTV